jgi:hypothetical protein
VNYLFDVKDKFHYTAIIAEDNFISQVFHQENTPAPGLLNIFRGGGIWQVFVIKPLSFIFYLKGDLTVVEE